jgi:hypothetical protein
MGAKWITHKGIKILYQDYRGESETQMLDTLSAVEKMLRESPKKVPILSNVLNCSISPTFMDRSKVLGDTVFKEKVSKGALLGITGLKQILYNAYSVIANKNGTPLKICKNEAEALDWLVSYP